MIEDGFWGKLPDNLTVLERMELAENKVTGSISSTNSESNIEKVMSLPNEDPKVGERYIFAHAMLLSNLFMIPESPDIVTVNKIKEDDGYSVVYVTTDSGEKKKYPDEAIRTTGLHKSFFFKDTAKYDKFRSIVRLIFDKELPSMTLTESLLHEARHSSIILVDFQPAYHSDDFGYEPAIIEAIEYLNEHKNANITAFFNGEDVGIEDTAHEVAWHYVEFGLDEEIAQNIKFREKTYAFLRNWMDEGVGNSDIIKVVRYLVMHHMTDSREIDDEEWTALVGEDFQYHDDREMNIYVPDVNIAELKKLNGSLMGGGGKHECLRELQLFMNAFNIKYKEVEDWTYG